MKISSLIVAGFIFQCATAPCWAGDDTAIARLATCQDSWLDWQKSDPAQMKNIGDHFHANFSPSGNDPFLVPKTNLSIAGLHITQAFPSSVGMGVGFSVTVAAPFDVARKAVETLLGKKLDKCDDGEGMKTCGLQLAEKRTVMVMAEDNPKSASTLVGCYYYYEK